MQKRARIEGGDWSQLVQQIREIGRNKDINVEYAVVITPPPALSIEMERDQFPIDTNDNLTILEHLTAHTRTATIDGVPQTLYFGEHLKTGDRVIVLTDSEKQSYTVLDKAVT